MSDSKGRQKSRAQSGSLGRRSRIGKGCGWRMIVLRMIVKRLMRILVKHMPGYNLRPAMLRACGCQVGHNAYVGEDLIIVDEPRDWGMITIGDRAAISPA